LLNLPVTLILEQNLGIAVSKIFMVVIVVSIFACGLVCSTSATRIVYTMSRDNAFFASKLFRRVNPKTSTPIPACILLWVLGLLSILFASSITILALAASVLPAIYYLITIVSYALARKKVNFRKDCFNMGKWAPAVIILSILWLVFAIGILTIPKEFHQATLVNGIIIVVGIVLYWVYFKWKYAKNAADEIEKENLFKDVTIEASKSNSLKP